MAIQQRVAAALGVTVFLGSQELLASRDPMVNQLQCSTSDLVALVEGGTEAALRDAHAQIENLLSEKKGDTSKVQEILPRTLSEVEAGSHNVVFLSVPGRFAAAEGLKALNAGYHVMSFSDNVTLDDEIELKQLAASKGLYFMGPDCGTAMLDGTPLGFCNRVRRGSVGLIGAAGTGLQQVSSLIHEMGGGVSQMFGLGGRDLSDRVGGIMMLQALRQLNDDPATATIVLVSKPPSPQVAKMIEEETRKCSKRVIIHFIGHGDDTLEDAALYAMGRERTKDQPFSGEQTIRNVYGLFSGGSFMSEAKGILPKGSTIIDFGDDEYTVGKPHPMIDLSTRTEYMTSVADPSAILLLDVVLGLGAHPAPAQELAGTIAGMIGRNPGITVITHVCGTKEDGLAAAEEALRAAGAIVTSSNARACRLARDIAHGMEFNPKSGALPSVESSLFAGMRVINIGPGSLLSVPATSLEWRPPAEGNVAIASIVADLHMQKAVTAANSLALDRIVSASPMLRDVVPASTVIPFLSGTQRALLHAGPPIQWERMCGPMRGAIIGACVFEGWAPDVAAAIKLLDGGGVSLSPCHEHAAVGPMAGVIGPSFPVWVVEAGSTTAYSSLNEGLGKVLRFGSYSAQVIQRLGWMRDVLAPSLSRALKGKPTDLWGIVSRALQMGDECHNRNFGASSLLFRELAPRMVESTGGRESVSDCLSFLNQNDHFFLNLSMAACKAALDCGANVPHSTVVVAMARNGVDFGVRLSGTGNTWFTAPSPIVSPCVS